MLDFALRNIVLSCVDSAIESTRVYWRERLGFPPNVVNSPLSSNEAVKSLTTQEGK